MLSHLSDLKGDVRDFEFTKGAPSKLLSEVGQLLLGRILSEVKIMGEETEERQSSLKRAIEKMGTLTLSPTKKTLNNIQELKALSEGGVSTRKINADDKTVNMEVQNRKFIGYCVKVDTYGIVVL